jgi:hypothetical protein
MNVSIYLSESVSIYLSAIDRRTAPFLGLHRGDIVPDRLV